jgi:hypothetical protein
MTREITPLPPDCSFDIFVVGRKTFRQRSAVLAGSQRKNVRNAQLKEEEEKTDRQRGE